MLSNKLQAKKLNCKHVGPNCKHFKLMFHILKTTPIRNKIGSYGIKDGFTRHKSLWKSLYFACKEGQGSFYAIRPGGGGGGGWRSCFEMSYWCLNVIVRWPLCRKQMLRSNDTLWSKYDLRKNLQQIYFQLWQIWQVSHTIPWKRPSFPEISRAQNPLKIANKNSRENSFLIV